MSRFKKDYSIDSTGAATTFIDTFNSYFGLATNKNQVSWIFDCIDIWGKHFAKVKFRLYEKYSDGSKQEINEHPILNMFVKPNNFQTWWEVMYRTAQHFALFGNVYLYKLRNGLGLPMQLIQLIPNRLTPMPNRVGGVLEAYQYDTGNSTVELKASDIIHFRYPDPVNLLFGKSVIANIMDTVEVEQFQTAYLKAFYKEGGFLGLTYTTDQKLNEPTFNRTKDELTRKHRGVEGSYKVGLLDSGLKPVSPPYSLRDMEVNKLRDQTRDEVCAAFQVHKFMLGMNETINRATSQEVSLQFASGVIEPIMTYFDTVLTFDLAMEFGDMFCIEHDNTSPRDQNGELEYYTSGLQNGWLTPNEVREWESLEPLNIDYMNQPMRLYQNKKIK